MRFLKFSLWLIAVVVALAIIGSLVESERSAEQSDRTRQPGYVSAQQLGEAWPLTVTDGVLHCQVQEPYLRVYLVTENGEAFALNGSAISSKRFGDVTRIRRPAKDLFTVEPAEGVDEPTRRAAFGEVVACEDSGRGSAACKAAVAKTRRLSGQQIDAIAKEGVSKNWPPLSPAYMSVQPLIDRGLKLCRS